MRTSSAISQRRVERDCNHDRDAKHVIACVNESTHPGRVLPHALAIARALRLPVILLQVLEPPPTRDFRLDPIEWDIRRHEARSALKRLAEASATDVEIIEAEVVEGRSAEEICRRTRERPAELIVVGTHGERGPGQYGIGETTRHVLEEATGPILIVPDVAVPDLVPHYRRILVPLDGSAWSESALPMAVRVARAADAELVLVHVVPAPELIETDPLEAEDLELRNRVVARNARIAQVYLDRVRGYTAGQGLSARVLTLHGDDARTSLTDLIRSERVDLVVLSARGHGGRCVSDVPYGSVAGYLVTHSPAPILMVRPTGPSKRLQLATMAAAGRLPAKPIA
jgi:nucleotide-binding universal stress UspA family protein